MLELEKQIIVTKIPSRAACFRKEGAKRSVPGTDSESRGYKPTWTSSRSPNDVPRRTACLLPQISTRSDGTLGKTAKRSFLVTDYPISLPVCLPWGIIPTWSEAPKQRCRDGTLTCAGCSRSVASKMRSSRLANVQHAGVARSKQVWLLRLGSAPLQSCGATGRGQDQQTWPLVAGFRFQYICLGA